MVSHRNVAANGFNLLVEGYLANPPFICMRHRCSRKLPTQRRKGVGPNPKGAHQLIPVSTLRVAGSDTLLQNGDANEWQESQTPLDFR